MTSAPRPYTLVAELTYDCPLHCGYCSNPVDRTGDELDPGTWERVLDEAAALGVVQVHLTGGEPLRYRGLSRLVARGRALEMYVNLITSGVPLTREQLQTMVDAGLDHVQLSLQHADREVSDRIAGARVFERKLSVARWVNEVGLPLTINVVLHRDNIDAVPAIVALARRLDADRLELANAQYLGIAFANRGALAPTRDQVERAYEAAARARDQHAGAMEIIFVKPDYFSETPRACMDGWGRRYIVVSPEGRVMPCHAAGAIRSLDFDHVRERSLVEIWQQSPALERFRGDAWMQEPCRSCERKAVDFGGCRCQAFLLGGDAAVTDPACARSPRHGAVAREDLVRSSLVRSSLVRSSLVRR